VLNLNHQETIMSESNSVTVAKSVKEPTPRRTIGRNRQSLDELTLAIRESVREEVRQEELQGLENTINDLRTAVLLNSERFSTVAQKLSTLCEDGIKITTPEGTVKVALDGTVELSGDLAQQTTPSTVEEETSYRVHAMFMDFIEVHAALAKGYIDRRPLLQGEVRANYSDNAEPQLVIQRRGTYGTNPNMYNPILRLCIHDEEPYIAGEYLDGGTLYTMSDDQTDRAVKAILEAVRDTVQSNS
jgi:hypothetical protein